MKISLHWLKDYIDIKHTPQELAHLLTMHALEVESVQKVGEALEGVVVGEILSLEKHPNADLLRVTTVDIGTKDPLTIVCGGVNIAVGQKVPVATPGSILPGGIKIKSTKIRNVASDGMLCSSQELGFAGEGHKRILILHPLTKAGSDISKVLDLTDTILEIAIPANRGDVMSHIGIAREVAALTGQKFSAPSRALPKVKKNTLGQLALELKAKNLCHRYAALIIDHITIAPSPQWMQNRLRAAGTRPINNIVDLTNYIMLDKGQPLHAFDFHKIAGLKKKITLRLAKEGESLKTLDEQERELHATNLIIDDGEKIIDLAGIMGGANSAIDEKTTTIVLQAAIFQPSNIRTTSRQMGHRTQAVAFFEKGIDPSLQPPALSESFHLLKEMDDKVEVINILDHEYHHEKQAVIPFHPSSVLRLTGQSVKEEKMKKILKNFGMELSSEQGGTWKITPPSFRKDIENEYDLVEEIIRAEGYHNIPATLPRTLLQSYSYQPFVTSSPAIKNIFLAKGFDEVCNYSFKTESSKRGYERTETPFHEAIRIANPLSEEQRYLRKNMRPGLLKNIHENFKNFDQVKIFEWGSVYRKEKNEYLQLQRLAAAVATKARKKEEEVFLEAKEVAASITQAMNTEIQQVNVSDSTGEKLEYRSSNHPFLWVERVPSEDLLAFDIEGSVAVLALDTEFFLRHIEKNRPFQKLPHFPPVKLDMAFLIDTKYPFADITHHIRHVAGPLLKELTLFDRYTGAHAGEHRQSLALHCVYQSDTKTLELPEIKALHEKITASLQKKFHIQPR